MNANNGTHPNSTANQAGAPHQNTMLNASQETPGFNASAHTASQAYSAQQQWTPEAAYASCASPAQNGPVQQKGSASKTKKQLIGLTCALSLVCGMLGGVIGGGSPMLQATARNREGCSKAACSNREAKTGLRAMRAATLARPTPPTMDKAAKTGKQAAALHQARPAQTVRQQEPTILLTMFPKATARLLREAPATPAHQAPSARKLSSRANQNAQGEPHPLGR